MSTQICESCALPATVELALPGATFRLCLRCVLSEHLDQVIALPGAEDHLELMHGFIAAHHPTEQLPALATTGGTR